MVITISSSIKFYDEVLWWKEALLKLGHTVLCFSTDNKGIGTDLLSVEHDRKIMISDALLVVNKDGYIGDSVVKEIGIARDNRIDVFTTEKYESMRYLSKFKVEDKAMFLTIPSTNYYIFNDNKYDDPILEDSNMYRFPLMSRPDYPNANGYTYTLNGLIKGLEAERIHELYDTESFYIEFTDSAKKDQDSLLVIDLKNAIGKFVAISNRYLYVCISEDKKEELSKHDNLYAFMRYTALPRNKSEYVSSDVMGKHYIIDALDIITWDLYTPKDYTLNGYIKEMESIK